ncbi:MAG: 16S rRNA (uracil(1498)-N(3))-methyltransferase [Acidobacteriota bacterium]|nr:16S rRNA (uracil(1498)-N(3))-methyltransferase [Acidobacteriota bacterium]
MLNLEETRHLRDVLRLKETAVVQVFDGAGREFLCEIQKIEKKETLLKIIEETTPPAPESNLNLILAVALLKGEKFDLVVQKAVELGVTSLVPLNTKRAEVQLKDTNKRLERWRKIALEAAKQSGRAKLMTIEKPLEFKDFIETANGTRILFAERGGARFSDIKETKKITAAVGAEGGWEALEIESAREKDFQIITFGGRILRAETAAVSIAAVLQHRFGDFV